MNAQTQVLQNSSTISSTDERASARGSANVKCFTLSLDPKTGNPSIKDGIAVSMGVFGPLVLIGSEENGGSSHYLKIKETNSPKIIDEKVVSGSFVFWKKDGKRYQALYNLDPTETDNRFLVKTETGHHSILSVKISHGSMKTESGEPQRLFHGTSHSRKGLVRSNEELWLLKEGDGIIVRFVTGTSIVLNVENNNLSMTPLKMVEEKKKEEPSIIEAAYAAIEIAGDGEKEIKNRDWGYHQIIGLAEHSTIEWSAVGILFSERVNDIRKGVHDHFMKKCEDFGVSLSFTQNWKNTTQGKKMDASSSNYLPAFVSSGRKSPNNGKRAEVEARRKANRLARLAAQPKRGSSSEIPFDPKQPKRGKKDKK